MTEKEIHKICKRYKIEDYIINDDMTIDIDNSVEIFRKGLHELPLNFNKVNGGFFCHGNYLTSLKGAPKYVKGDFYCHNNKLDSLEHCPKRIDGGFFIFKNNIKTFEYFPQIKGYFILTNNPIQELWNLFENKDYIEYFNELDIIQENGKVVILDRLNYFLTDIGENEKNEDNIYYYTVK